MNYIKYNSWDDASTHCEVYTQERAGFVSATDDTERKR